MSAAFLEAAIPEPVTVLGRSLEPYTLGHDLILQRFGSRFASTATEPPDYEDLVLSVFICSHTYEEALAQLSNRWLGLKLKLWGWRCGNFDVAEALKFFGDYIALAMREVDFWVEDEAGSGRPSAIPFAQFLKIKLEQDLGYSEREALNTPFQMAMWNYLTALESKGQIRFVTDEDREAQRMVNDPTVQAELKAWADSLPKE